MSFGKAPTAPNQLCRIIGSTAGPNGTSVGRKCVTVKKITDRPPHSLWGEMWECESADSLPFDIEYGDGTKKKSMRAVFAEDWLEVIEPDSDVKEEEKEKELTE